MGITIVGLGPGDGRYLTRQAWQILSSAATIYLRTTRHPTVLDLPDGANLVSFDDLYDQGETFDQVYDSIVTEILRRAEEARNTGLEIVYAVPGHPLVGEYTVSAIIAAAKKLDVPVNIVPGMSFVEPTLEALEVDALDGLQLFDAIQIAQYNHPPLSGDIPLLLAQVYSQLLASELKLALMVIYPDEHEVVLVHGAGTSDQAIERIPLFAIDRSAQLSHLTSLFIPPLPSASGLTALAETVAFLRGPSGCPWDQEQTRQSLRDGFLEEASEVLAAIDQDDGEALCEELGDMLYHLVMQVQIASELNEFKLSDVIAGIENKLKRRHPHVWGDWQVEDSAEVVRNWEWLKEQEKANVTELPSILDNIPYSLPALARARKIQEKVKRVGFDWPAIDGVITKVEEEIVELQAARDAQSQQAELGDALFAIVNWGRWLGLDAEISLREANQRFAKRFRNMEQLAAQKGLELMDLDLEALDALWEASKVVTGDDSSSIRPGGDLDMRDPKDLVSPEA